MGDKEKIKGIAGKGSETSGHSKRREKRYERHRENGV